MSSQPSFEQIIADIPDIGMDKHREALINNATQNKSLIKNTIRNIPIPEGKKSDSVIVINAGPSVRRQKTANKIAEHSYSGTVVACDGAYVTCLRAGLIPDYVLSLDPHPKRIVRWYGDPNLEENMKNDDYFERQDLDISFRDSSMKANEEVIELVNTHAHKTKSILCTSVSKSLTDRIQDAGFDIYWWNPLIDNPNNEDSLTRKLYDITKAPAMNTGGNVGTASWVFAASKLNIGNIAVTGMDLGYYADLPYEKSQVYYELANHIGGTEGIEKYFKHFTFPLTGEKYYTDPCYYWYRNNFLDLLKIMPGKTVNCTGGGVLYSDNLECLHLDDFIAQQEKENG